VTVAANSIRTYDTQLFNRIEVRIHYSQRTLETIGIQDANHFTDILFSVGNLEFTPQSIAEAVVKQSVIAAFYYYETTVILRSF